MPVLPPTFLDRWEGRNPGDLPSKPP